MIQLFITNPLQGVWKQQQFILAQGQVNCHEVLVHLKFYLSHIKEPIMHKDLSKSLAVLKQYTCINSFKNSMKPDIKIKLFKTVQIQISWLLQNPAGQDPHCFYTTCEFTIITKYKMHICKFILSCQQKFLTCPG